MGADKETSLPTREHCGFSHSESEKQPLRANGFNRIVSRGTHQRAWDKARATALGLLRPSGAVVEWPLAGGENRRPPPSRVRGYHYGSDITVRNQLELGLTPLEIRPALAFW